MAEGQVWHVAADVVEAGAARLVAAVLAADARRGAAGARLGIPGGSALSVALRARAALDDAVWARLRLVFVDERRVPADDPASNFGAALRGGLFAGGAPAVVLRLVLDGEPVEAALARVEAAFARDFGGALDVALLGMGPDGHIASLFPGLPALGGVAGYVTDAPKPPPERFTLNRSTLASAAATVLVAAGGEKRAALARLLAEDSTLPAVGLGGLEVVTDPAGNPANTASRATTNPAGLPAMTGARTMTDQTERRNDVAVVGLGVMGANLARNFASRGLAVSGYNRGMEAARAVAAAHPEADLDVAGSLAELVARLERPRRIVLMVPAGAPVDDVLDALDPLLEQDDIVVDAGNSLFSDTDRRSARADGRPWRFVGMGVSGGAEGALLGPAIMPGGDKEAWDRLQPVLTSIAARSESGPCVAYCGRGSAGHFVKMVHNGIEYGDMQLIAETATLLRRGLGLTPDAVADTFTEWNAGDLDSFLVEITADIFRTKDPRGTGLLVDAILDRAGQKGTGRWTVQAALDLGVAIPTIAAAVDARVMSAGRDLRMAAEEIFGRPAGGLAGVTIEDLADALYASKIASYAQGFAMLASASEARSYGTDLAEVARIWTAGCIIRARFLGRVAAAFRSEPAPELLALAPDFAAELRRRAPAWRRVVSAATGAGLAVPALAASLTWFDTLTTARGSASLIQAQRDYFGSHTYERLDAPGTAVHTDWPRGGDL